jgi:hypothetical protein
VSVNKAKMGTQAGVRENASTTSSEVITTRSQLAIKATTNSLHAMRVTYRIVTLDQGQQPVGRAGVGSANPAKELKQSLVVAVKHHTPYGYDDLHVCAQAATAMTCAWR